MALRVVIPGGFGPSHERDHRGAPEAPLAAIPARGAVQRRSEESYMAADREILDYAALLLIALTNMAAHSGRHQAEVGAALHRARLPSDAARLPAAIGLLQAEACVANPVSLADGGMLLTVTGHALRVPSDQGGV